MSLPIHFFTAVVPKATIIASFDGGLNAFRHCYPDHLDDGELLGAIFMSCHEAEEFLACLSKFGVNVASEAALVDMHHGLLTSPVDGIVIDQRARPGPFPEFHASASEPTDHA